MKKGKFLFYSFPDLALEKCPRNCPRILKYLSQKNVICPREISRKSQNGSRNIWHVCISNTVSTFFYDRNYMSSLYSYLQLALY